MPMIPAIIVQALFPRPCRLSGRLPCDASRIIRLTFLSCFSFCLVFAVVLLKAQFGSHFFACWEHEQALFLPSAEHRSFGHFGHFAGAFLGLL